MPSGRIDRRKHDEDVAEHVIGGIRTSRVVTGREEPRPDIDKDAPPVPPKSEREA